MITTIILITLTILWLGYETKWFTIRLLVGKDKPHSEARTIAQWDEYNKVHAKEIEQEQLERERKHAEYLKHNCTICHETFENPVIETREVKSGNSVCHIKGCPDCITKYIKEINNAQIIRQSVNKTSKPVQPSLFITRERVGSHQEWTCWNNETNKLDIISKYKKGYSKRVVEEYATVYHDCLISKEWIKANENFKMPESTIEIIINDKALSVNGNYKKGLIGEFMSQYTQKARAGKKTITILKGGHVENLGSGTYVAVNGKLVNGEYQYF